MVVPCGSPSSQHNVMASSRLCVVRTRTLCLGGWCWPVKGSREGCCSAGLASADFALFSSLPHVPRGFGARAWLEQGRGLLC